MGAKVQIRVLKGAIAEEVSTCIRIFSEQLGCEILEMNIQTDHVHLLEMVPPKVSISGFVGTIKGRTAIRVLNKFRKLKERPYWGNHLWARGYCVDTVGLDLEMIRKYVKDQERKRKNSGKVAVLATNITLGDNSPFCLLRGQKQFHPLQGLFQSRPLRGRLFTRESSDFFVLDAVVGYRLPRGLGFISN